MTSTESPDCAVAKHTACVDRAWSDDLDQEVTCGCWCHDAPSPAHAALSEHHTALAAAGVLEACS